MPTLIRIEVNDLTLRSELNDTPGAQAVAASLPVESHPQTWGEEFYFDIRITRVDD